MAELIPDEKDGTLREAMHLREKRLINDLRSLVEDPPPGIRAQPLDASNYHWQASILGPSGSPFEGGLFFLYLKVSILLYTGCPKVNGQNLLFFMMSTKHPVLQMTTCIHGVPRLMDNFATMSIIL